MYNKDKSEMLNYKLGYKMKTKTILLVLLTVTSFQAQADNNGYDTENLTQTNETHKSYAYHNYYSKEGVKKVDQKNEVQEVCMNGYNYGVYGNKILPIMIKGSDTQQEKCENSQTERYLMESYP
jgi:hypothetical protein